MIRLSLFILLASLAEIGSWEIATFRDINRDIESRDLRRFGIFRIELYRQTIETGYTAVIRFVLSERKIFHSSVKPGDVLHRAIKSASKLADFSTRAAH